MCYFLAGPTPQSHFLRLHHPSMVFPKFTLVEYKCSFCLQEACFFFDSYRFYQFTNIEVTNTSFLRRFIFVWLEVWILSRCWTWNWRGDFWVSVFVFFFIHILTSMNRALIGMWRLTIRVRVTLFFLLKEVINLYVLLKMALNDKLIFYKFVIPQKPFYIC